METEIRLKKILDACGKDKHGVIQTIANETGMNRHTVRKLYYNETNNFSMETIGRVCEWLEEKQLCEGLPGALFAARPSKLVKAMTEGGRVTIYMGEYRSEVFPRLWTARDDAAAAFKLVNRLSRFGREHPAHITQVNVPSHVPINGDSVDASAVKQDRQVASRIFKDMRDASGDDNAILIGSQRANYLVEFFVSELFRSTAFKSGSSAVPFYLKYHEKPRVSSCFGGNVAPVRHGSDAPIGIYYRDKRKRWQCMPSEPCKQGAGLAIFRRDPGLGRLEAAVFGLSAIATAAMGKLVSEAPARFWPPTRQRGGLEVGVYVCGFTLDGMTTGEEGIDQVQVGSPTIERLDITIPGKRAA